tara:strand:- start:42 stop:1100 length:1059 start_codon:yes stop_codon:yes gene_type:complete
MATPLPYLPQVQFVEVNETTTTSQYLKHVLITEAIDENGDPWRPNTWDPLENVTKSSTTGSTVLGSTLTGTPATWSGGEPPVEEISQWQRSDDGTAFTGFTPWVAITEPVEYTTVEADNGKYLRLASKATDANGVVYGSGNNVGPMVPQTIVVTEPTTMTNGTYLNPQHAYLHETLSMNSAVMAGGYGAITYKYRLQEKEHGTDTWTNLTSFQSGVPTYEVQQSDEGDQLRFQTQGTDATGQTKISNSGIATVAVSTEIGTVSTNQPEAMTADPGELIGFTATCSGDADPMYFWSIRTGPAQITSTYNFGPTSEVTINADASSGETVQVQVTADDPSATDTPQSTVITIIVN